LWDADVKMADEKVAVHDRVDNDNFFDSASSSEDEKEKPVKVVEKRAVMRDGRVPKLAKNYEIIEQKKIEKQRIAEGWYEDEPVEEP